MIPKPKVPLNNHCSVIYNQTLYTYQPDAFQSLDLKEGGQWAQLPMGVSTQGSQCVLGTWDDQPALILVGGTAKDDSFSGVQHFSFQDNQWKSDHPADEVAMNRLRHGAVFLQQSAQILTYGGSQDNDNGFTSQTFLLSSKAPYGTSAWNSKAPPVTDPILLQYNTTHALLLGGDPRNTNLFLFDAQNGWTKLDKTLRTGMRDRDEMQASILDGDHGEKLLEIFDMHDTPNSLSTVTLQGGNAKSRRDFITPHHPFKRRKRDASTNRPSYNNTLAPDTARSGFSLAADPKDGLVVMSGGSDQNPIAMFNDTGNSWMDPNVFFNGAGKTTPSPTSSSSSSAAPTFTPSASPSAIAKEKHDSRNKSLTILGGTLGGVLGAAVLLAIILLLLRCMKKRKQRQHREQEFKEADKQEMDFMDMGADFMRDAGGSASGSHHERNKSDGTTHKPSRAASNNSRRALLHAKGDSGDSQRSFWSGRSKTPVQAAPQISAPIQTGPSLTRSMASPGLRNDNGWSAYFMDNQMNEPVQRSDPPSTNPRPDTYASHAQSTSSYAPSNLHSSAEVEPLNWRPSQLYPPTGLGVALSHGVSRPSSAPQVSPTPSVVSDIEEESEYRMSHSEGEASWSPVASSGERTSAFTSSDNRTSGNTNSYHTEHIAIPNFPMPTSGRSSLASPVTPQGEMPPPLPRAIPPRDDPRDQQQQAQQGLRNVMSRDLIRSNSARQRATDVVRTGTQRINTSATAGPVPREQVRTAEQRESEGISEDMSWLNLGTSAEQKRGIYANR